MEKMTFSAVRIPARHAFKAVAPSLAAGLMLLGLLSSCAKEGREAVPSGQEKEIVFLSREAHFAARSGVTEVSELPSFNVSAVRGEAGSETAVWSVASTLEGAVYTTGRFWPVEDMGYRFYASNAPLVDGAAGATVSVDCTQDVVCAYLPNPVYGDRNTLAFDHILARIGSFAVTVPDGYTLTASSFTLFSSKTGTYNLRTGAWSGLGAAAGSAVAVGANDVWTVPGACTLEGTFTLTKGDFSKAYTRSASLTLEAGKICSVTAHITDDEAVGITFTATVTPWQDQDTEITLD